MAASCLQCVSMEEDHVSGCAEFWPQPGSLDRHHAGEQHKTDVTYVRSASSSFGVTLCSTYSYVDSHLCGFRSSSVESSVHNRIPSCYPWMMNQHLSLIHI